MTPVADTRSATRWLSIAIGAAAAVYATYVGVTWLRFGHASPAVPEEQDLLLDQFLPVYDVAERHHIRVDAPAETTFAAACEVDLLQSPIVRAIFKAREVILGSEPDTVVHPRGLHAWARSIGWGVLAEAPSRAVVMGAVTKPWEANVVFRALPPPVFAAFREPGYVKIAWTIRADPITPLTSVFRTETRTIATDASARRTFRRYWSLLSPGIIVIRWLMLTPVRAEAERRARNHRMRT